MFGRPASRGFVYLHVVVILVTISLFVTYTFRSIPFYQNNLRFADFHEGHELRRDMTVWLNPQEHQSRGNTTIHLDWVVSKGLTSPDGVPKWVYQVNGVFTSSAFSVALI